MVTQTIFEGGCLCGAIRYRPSAPSLRGVICHCSMCRRHSGAPLLAFVQFPLDSFQWTKGEPALYRSSKFAQRGFCAACGSTLSMVEEAIRDRVQITLGSLDEPGRVSIDDHVWTENQVAWFEVKDDLPRFPRDSAAAPGHS